MFMKEMDTNCASELVSGELLTIFSCILIGSDLFMTVGHFDRI